jgi:hypothetical protein
MALATTVRVVVLAACALSIGACSVLLDWNGYTDGTDADAASTADGPRYLLTCGTNKFCAPAAPSGWSGPVVFAEFDGTATPPSCGNDYSTRFQGKAGLDAGPAVCTCSCSDPTGVTCPMPKVDFFSDNSCSTPCGNPMPLNTSACVAPPTNCTNLEIEATVTTGGSCMPTSVGMTVPPSAWTRQSLACAPMAVPDQGTCSSGEFCLPGAPSSLSYCVSQAGKAASCPANSAYTQGPFVEYSGNVTDTRACSPCGCSPPDGGTCSPPQGLIFDKMCNIPAGPPLISPMGCSLATGLTAVMASSLRTSGQCASTGGAPQGTATPSDPPTTFCCTP